MALELKVGDRFILPKYDALPHETQIEIIDIGENTTFMASGEDVIDPSQPRVLRTTVFRNWLRSINIKRVKPLKVYPFEGNQNLLYVCWSVGEQIKNADHAAITHICQDDGQKTLCGISTQSGYHTWDFEIWDLNPHLQPWRELKHGVSDIGCIRCKKSKKLQTKQD